MPAKTPETLTTFRAGSTSYFVDPGRGAGDWNGTEVQSTEGLKHRQFSFDDIDTTDTWTSGLTGIVRWAWETASGTQQVLVTESSGTFTFATSAANAIGILHVWTQS